MTDPARTLLVEDVSHGGGLDSGRSVYFDARLADGSAVRMVLPHTHVSAFIAKVMAFAGVAIRFQIQPGVSMVFPLQTRFLPQVSASLMKWHSGLQDVSAQSS